jgi:pimeloyl-ACP methyl ester carboxylesterase
MGRSGPTTPVRSLREVFQEPPPAMHPDAPRPPGVDLEQEVRFCTAPDGVRIAWASTGQGPPLVKAANWLNHLEFDLRSPVWTHWLRGLSATHRLIRYDERGCGLSDWDAPGFSLEHWVQDLEAVVEASGVERFPLLGISQGGPVAITYAVRNPERVSHLILYGIYARGWMRRELSPEELARQEALITLTLSGWGQDTPAYRQLFSGLFVPDANEEELKWFNELQRISTSPENAVRFQRAFADLDVTDLLAQVSVPTLVLHVRDDARIPFAEGRRIAGRIPDCRFVALEGRNHILLGREPAWGVFLEEVRRFLGVEAPPEEGRAGSEEGGGVGSEGADPGPPGFFAKVREGKVVQWTTGYVAAAWLALQFLSVLESPWDLSRAFMRGAQVVLATGIPLTLVLAWYHGEKGRQRVSGPELLIIGAILLLGGALLLVLVP